MQLTDICEINPKSFSVSDNTPVSFIAMPDVSEDGKINTTTARPFGEVKKGFTSFKDGDVLFAKITPCMENGKGALAINLINGLGCGSTEFHVLRPNPDVVIGKWLYYLTAWRSFRFAAERHMTGSAGQKRVPKSFLEKYEVNLPDLKIQRKQIDILNRIMLIIEARKRQITFFDDLIKARFVEMFGDSDKYPKAPLEDNVYEMFIGPFGSALKNECFVEPKDGYCIVYEQKHAIQKTMDVPTRYVDEKKYLEMKRFSVYPGDIIVSCRGTIGEIFIVPEGAPLGIMHPSIMKIRLNTEKYNQKFFVLALEQYMDEHNNEAKGSGVKMAVTATTLGKKQFIVPPMEVQKQFSTFLTQVDKSKLLLPIESTYKRRKKLKKVYNIL